MVPRVRLERALLVNVGAFVDLYGWLVRDWLSKVQHLSNIMYQSTGFRIQAIKTTG